MSRPTTSTSPPCACSKRRSEHFPGCAIVITHDRYFLDRVATHIIGFEGDGRVEFCTGSWETYAEQRAKRESEGRGASRAFKHRKIERAH